MGSSPFLVLKNRRGTRNDRRRIKKALGEALTPISERLEKLENPKSGDDDELTDEEKKKKEEEAAAAKKKVKKKHSLLKTSLKQFKKR
ncbi:hypothetical protein ABW365_12395 [Enterococcus avium]